MTFLFFLTKPVLFCSLQVNFFFTCPDFRNHISSQFYLPEILSPDPSLVNEKSDRICPGTEVPFNFVPEFSILCWLVHGFAKIFFFSFLSCYSRFESAKQFGSINRACDWTTSENTENKPQVAWLRFQRDIAPLCIFPPFRQPNALGHFLVSPLNSRLGLIISTSAL